MANKWGISENSDIFYFLGLKITVEDDCSYEVKRHSLKGDMTNLDSLLKSRDIILLTKVHISQSYDFSSNHAWM